MEKEFPDSKGVVTADADGQHITEDIVKIANKLNQDESALILGVRNFEKGVPFKSRFGNKLTRVLLKIFHGIDICDTQTGLRGIPKKAIHHFKTITYNHFEFNSEMLICSKTNKIPIVEVPIKTIYKDGNKGTHFNPIFDSVKIYFVLFRFVLSSLFAAGIDLICF